jgi:glyoxylase-like metal-dependent hydrolase (beta-lactamase superfamily II)
MAADAVESPGLSIAGRTPIRTATKRATDPPMVDRLTADELANSIDANDAGTVVDVRPESNFEAWHLPGAINAPYDPDEGLTDEALGTVNATVDDEPVVAVCAKGLTSAGFAFDLTDHGYDDVAVLEGGMEAWSEVYDVVPIETPGEDLVVKQLQRRAKGCLGYLIGSRSAGEGVLVDATRLRDEFEIAALEADVTVIAVLDTHVHADHVSGGPGVADTLDVPYRLGERARERGVQHDYDPLADGETIRIGDVTIEAIHAPGHTSEMVTYFVNDDVLLTGDTLFVDSIGRTELQFGEANAAHGAKKLYETLHDVLLQRPADVKVLPGHVSVRDDGRFENANPGEPVAARLGDLAESLSVLHLDRDDFVERVVENAPDKPPNYETIIARNTGRSEGTDGDATELELGPNNCAA